MNGCIIPEENEKSINPQQENAIFLVMGDEAYTDEMIDEYNRNAEAKTEEFNTNATNKLNAFNENATTKTNAFNTNATTQTDTYNSNAATKLSEYNDNATAKEQSYNSNADTKTQAFNQNAAQKTYEFNQNALAYQEGIEKNAEEIDEVSNRVYRIENNLYDSGTAEGYFINIEDSSYSEFQNVSVDGVCEQKTTTGKNLLNPIKFNNDEYFGITFKTLGDGSISLNGTASETIYRTIGNADLKANTNYTLSTDIDNTSNIQFYFNGEPTSSGTNWIPVSNNYTVFSVNNDISNAQINITIKSGATVNMTFKVQLEEGSAATSYEPYTGGQPSPSPDYPQPIGVIEEDFNITSCGKNLFGGFEVTKSTVGIDFTTYKDGSISAIGTATNQALSLYSADVSDYLRVLVPGTYTLSGGQNNIQVQVVQDDGTALTITPKASPYTITFTLNETKKIFVRALVENGVTVNTTIYPMLEQGSQATEYEPYQATTTQIALPEGQFAAKISDTIKDQFRIAYNESDGNYHLYLDKNVGKTILDGSENWSLYSQNPNRFVLNTPSSYINMKSSTYNTICDHYKYDASGSNYPCYATGKTYAIQIYDNQFTTVDDLKAWLQSNNVTVYYQLANPQTIDIGKVQMPLTYYPVTNVSTDCPLLPTIEVAYYRDFKTTIETMQEDIASNTSRIETLEEQLQSQATTISNLENRITALEPTQTESEVVEQ